MLTVMIYFSILNFVMIIQGNFQVLHGANNNVFQNKNAQNTREDVQVTDVKIETVGSPNKLVSLVPHQTFHVPQVCHLEATFKIVKTQSMVKLTLTAFEGNVAALGKDFTHDGGSVDAGDGFNSWHFKAIDNLPAGKEFHLTKVKAVIVTNVTTIITKSLPMEFTVIVASS